MTLLLCLSIALFVIVGIGLLKINKMPDVYKTNDPTYTNHFGKVPKMKNPPKPPKSDKGK